MAIGNITIRAEAVSDASAIEALTINAFKAMPYSQQTEHFIIRQLRKENVLSPSLVPELDGKIVGHVAASPVSTSDQSEG